MLTLVQVMGINGGEDTLAHWPASTGMKSIEEASCEVLTYLDSVWSSLSVAGQYVILVQIHCMILAVSSAHI